jgi:hypothetical protein
LGLKSSPSDLGDPKSALFLFGHGQNSAVGSGQVFDCSVGHPLLSLFIPGFSGLSNLALRGELLGQFMIKFMSVHFDSPFLFAGSVPASDMIIA